MWKVIQTRYIRGSTQNFPNELGQFTRKKQAMGEVKHQLNSHMEMLIKHEAPESYDDCIVQDGDNYKSVSFTDNKGIFYTAKYEVVEVPNEEVVTLKFNLLKELEILLDDYEEFRAEGTPMLFEMIYEDLEKLVATTRLSKAIKERNDRVS